MTHPAPTTPAPPLPPGSYRIDPATSTIHADVRAMFGLFTVHGTFRLRGGDVRIGPGAGQASVQASIDAGSFTSGLRARDQDVTSPALLDAAAYPDITFTADQIRPADPGWVADGTLTAHGQAVPASLHISTAQPRDGGTRFQAATRLDRTDFGITGKKGLVGRSVQLTIDAACHPA